MTKYLNLFPRKLTKLIVKWLRMNYGFGDYSVLHADVIEFGDNRIMVYNKYARLHHNDDDMPPSTSLWLCAADPDFFKKMTRYFKLDEKN